MNPNHERWRQLVDDVFALDAEHPYFGQTVEAEDDDREKHHGDHDQKDHGNWSDGGGGEGAYRSLPAKQAAKLQETEKASATARIEQGTVVASSGAVLVQKWGGEHSVKFEPDELKAMRGAILTHNHPTGISFSMNDLHLAIANGLEEIRVVTEDAVFRMRPGPNGWPSMPDVIDTAEWVEFKGEGKIRAKEYNHLRWEAIVKSKDMADRLVYERIPR